MNHLLTEEMKGTWAASCNKSCSPFNCSCVTQQGWVFCIFLNECWINSALCWSLNYDQIVETGGCRGGWNREHKLWMFQGEIREELAKKYQSKKGSLAGIWKDIIFYILNQVFVNLKKSGREGKYYLSSARIRARYLGTYWVSHKLRLVSHKILQKKNKWTFLASSILFHSEIKSHCEIGRGEGKDFLSEKGLEMDVKVGLGSRIPCWERGSAMQVVAFIWEEHRRKWPLEKRGDQCFLLLLWPLCYGWWSIAQSSVKRDTATLAFSQHAVKSWQLPSCLIRH